MHDQPTTYRNAEGTLYNTPYAIICSRHGPVCLNREQYMSQLMRSDDVWLCPKCGRPADWDDDCPTTNPPEEEIVP
jgi:hypothetical protein